jgi:hypothetical protein
LGFDQTNGRKKTKAKIPAKYIQTLLAVRHLEDSSMSNPRFGNPMKLQKI